MPFTVTIPADERDGELPAKLTAEQDGILAWFVRGAVDWRRSGLQAPDAVKLATEAYRTDQDTVVRSSRTAAWRNATRK